jgi:predicted O-linked N-acetylglucosamine transferase (SPINDLY family)
VNFLGYPSTMGGDFTDLIVTDRVSSPPALRHAYSEHMLLMPHTYQVCGLPV